MADRQQKVSIETRTVQSKVIVIFSPHRLFPEVVTPGIGPKATVFASRKLEPILNQKQYFRQKLHQEPEMEKK